MRALESLHQTRVYPAALIAFATVQDGAASAKLQAVRQGYPNPECPRIADGFLPLR